MTGQVILLIDLQNDYFPGGKLPLWNVEEVAGQAGRILADARAKGTPVVHVRHEFPDGNAPFFTPESHGARIHDSVAPIKGETVVLKHHANSFRETGLGQVLQDHGARELVIVGAMSHMCIDATARAAADLGYGVTVIHDAATTLDLSFGERQVPAPQVHAAFMAALGSGYARLVTADEHLGQ